jgi:hypothetical protein
MIQNNSLVPNKTVFSGFVSFHLGSLCMLVVKGIEQVPQTYTEHTSITSVLQINLLLDRHAGETNLKGQGTYKQPL